MTRISSHLFGVLIISLLLTGASCSRTEPAPGQAKTEPSASPIDLEGADAVRVIRLYYPLGRKAEHADWTWAGCEDDTKGYGNLFKCEQATADLVASVAAEVYQKNPTAVGDCGKQIEDAHRKYLTSLSVFHADHLAWFIRMKSQLATAMVGKTQRDACSERCRGEPQEGESGTPYEGANYSNVNVKCVAELFDCTPPIGNVCWINKIASRLGIGPDASPGLLMVKQTGTVIR